MWEYFLPQSALRMHNGHKEFLVSSLVFFVVNSLLIKKYTGNNDQ